MQEAIPERPPFALRALILTPLGVGETRYEPDGLLEVGADGRISSVGPYPSRGTVPPGGDGHGAVDLRPWLLLPGMVDLHVHLEQLPNAGLGSGIGLLPWLERYTFPLERAFDEATAKRVAPAAFRAMARAGTTTAVIYGSIYASSVDATFHAAEAHGLRAVIGQVLMDRFNHARLPPKRALETGLRESAELCERWHGVDGGRLGYAFTPRFVLTCSLEMLRQSAGLARDYGAWWQTHLSEDPGEVAEVARLHPTARDYLDVYDRAGGLGEKSVFAHAVHLSDRELDRLVESGSCIAHCPASNLFLAAGLMPLAHYRARGAVVGLGTDVAGGPDLSIFSVMRAGAYAQGARKAQGERRPPLGPLDWLRLGTLEGARALGLHASTGSLERGKDADLIAVDPTLSEPLPGLATDEPEELIGRLIFRTHPGMVRAAWVRGRALPMDGPI